MELADAQGFAVRVLELPPGIDPADDPAGFEARLARAKPYDLHGAQARAKQAPDLAAASQAVTVFLAERPDGPDKQEAVRWASDYFGMAPQLPTVRRAAAAIAPARLAAVERHERDALAGVVAHPGLRPLLAELTPEHFRLETHRALRAYLVDGTPLDTAGVALLAELDARAAEAGIDEETGTELLLRLRERELRRELQEASPQRTKELQEALTRVREAYSSLGERAPVSD
jgi:hypothetical protein